MSSVYEEENKDDDLTIFKSIDSNSDFEEAKNILQYQLSINFDVVIYNQVKNVIDALYFQTELLCSKYMYKIKKYLNINSKDPVWEFNDLVLRSSIKNHCIISALYTAKYLYLKDKKISIKELGEFSSNCGYWTLKEVINNLEQKSKRELPNVYSEKELKKRLQKTWKPVKYKDRCNYTNKFIKLADNNDYKYIINSLSTNNFNNIPLNDSDFTFSVMNYTKKINKKSTYELELNHQDMPIKIDRYLKNLKSNKQAGCINFYEKINEYVAGTLLEYNNDRIFISDGRYDLDDDFSKNKGHSNAIKYALVHPDNADRVLFNYKFERAFNKNLIDCILNEYKMLSKQDSSLLLGKTLNKVFCNCSLLPNSFSRTYFIKAILRNSNLPEFNETYNQLLESEYKYRKVKKAIRFNEESSNNKIEKSNEHISSFLNFIIHLSYVTIPIYERTFFIILYNYFNRKLSLTHSEDRNTISSNIENNREIMSQMLELLHDYVDENAEYLMCNFDYNYGYDIYDEIDKFNRGNSFANEFLLPGEAFFRSKNRDKYIDKIKQNPLNIQEIVDLNADFFSELISNTFTRTDIYNSTSIKFSGNLFIDDHKKMAERYIDNAIMNISKIISKITYNFDL